MAIYKNTLFVGAKGIYKNLPFEVLGSGTVDYVLSGGTYPAVEFYCLANNGQTWYFAVNDEEVYYCRELEKLEIQNLLSSLNPDQNYNSIPELLSNSKNVVIEEFGKGKLKKAEGRAKNDVSNFSEFEYYDLKIGSKSYSLDIFPDQKEGWFETIWVSSSELTKIFKQSLRLENKEADSIFGLAKIWQNLAVASIIIALLVLVNLFITNQNTKEIYSSEREINTKPNTQIVFDKFVITKIKKAYTLKIEANLPDDYGVSLNIGFLDNNNQIASSSNQEFFRTGSSNEQVFSNVFYPTQELDYSPVVKINDYSKVGENTNLDIYPNIKIIIKIYEGGSDFIFHSLTVFGLVILSIVFLSQKKRAEAKFWET